MEHRHRSACKRRAGCLTLIAENDGIGRVDFIQTAEHFKDAKPELAFLLPFITLHVAVEDFIRQIVRAIAEVIHEPLELVALGKKLHVLNGPFRRSHQFSLLVSCHRLGVAWRGFGATACAVPVASTGPVGMA